MYHHKTTFKNNVSPQYREYYIKPQLVKGSLKEKLANASIGVL